MFKLKLNLDYKLNYPDGSKPENLDKEQAEITKGYIDYAVAGKYKDGLNGQLRRKFSRIQSKIEDAIKDKSYEADLEPEEIEFIRNCFEDEKVKFNATIAKFVVVLEDHLFDILSEYNSKSV